MFPLRHNPPRRRRPITALVTFGVLMMLVSVELIARFGLGLGDPPLFQKDDTIEYLIKPGTYHRFGNTIRINRWSQRSPEIEAKKSDSNELRVLVIGDSVVNGGALLDDAQIATTMLERSLARQLNRPVRVLNISAGSWGPANQLAYLEKFGTFQADAAVIVWSSHDAWDVPRFEQMRADQPTRAPTLALTELMTRYLLPKLRRSAPPAPSAPPSPDFDHAIKTAADLIQFAEFHRLPIAVVLHETRGEIQGTPPVDRFLERGRLLLTDMVSASGVPLARSRERFAAALARGEAVYQDDIHPSALGQRLLADSLEESTRSLINTPRK